MKRAVVSLALFSFACGAATPRAEEAPMLTSAGWSDANRARLDRLLEDVRAREGRRVAVFDWDNTMMRGDIGDLSLAYALEHDRIRAPLDELIMLTPAAREELRSICGDTVTSADPECRSALAHLAFEGTTTSGAPGFEPTSTAHYRATYGFAVQLFAGHTREELLEIARAAWADASRAPVGARADVAGVELERFARLHDPMVELFHAIEHAGGEVWVVSASLQPFVEVVAEAAGIESAHVIGVRPQIENDRTTTRFMACGDDDGSPVMSWSAGKPCWIRQVIFDGRPVFAAGDSDGDAPMLASAELRLVLDRHATRLMCRALSDPEHWLVQPQFVDPPAPRTEPYPCSTYTDALGPVLDEGEQPIPDQPPR